jgi:ribonuclease-3
MQPPRYVQIARNGPDHAPEFEIAVRLEDGREAMARGTGTKRSIEQAAAQALLDQIEGST